MLDIHAFTPFLPRDDTVEALVSPNQTTSVSDPANQPCADPPTSAEANYGHQSSVPAPAYAPHNNKSTIIIIMIGSIFYFYFELLLFPASFPNF